MKEKKTATLHTRIAPTLGADLKRVAEEQHKTVARLVDETLTKAVRQHDYDTEKGK